MGYIIVFVGIKVPEGGVKGLVVICQYFKVCINNKDRALCIFLYIAGAQVFNSYFPI